MTQFTSSKLQPPCSSLAFSGKVVFGHHLLKLLDVLEIRDELNGIAAAVQSTRSNHPHVTHCVTCVRQRQLMLVLNYLT